MRQDFQPSRLGSRHILTPEYPPQLGGVGDYACQLASGLAGAGEDVHVWCPGVANAPVGSEAVEVHRELGAFSPSGLRAVGKKLDSLPAPRRILVQWVPHGFGYRSMNLPFCFWLWRRSKKGDRVEIMVHEAFLAFEGSWRQYAAAFVHRFMTVVLLHVVERVWVSIPKCEQLWRPYALGRRIPFQWLPSSSNVPVAMDPESITNLRRRYAPEDGVLIGHFGTFGKNITSLLDPLAFHILKESANVNILMIGPGSNEFLNRFLQRHPQLQDRIYSTGPFASNDPELSRLISACDVMIQPYPDGVTSRRGTLMAGLNHGKPIVTTRGPGTEPLWSDSEAVVMSDVSDLDGFVKLVRDLSSNAGKRTRMALAARRLYEEHFDIAHAVAVLGMTARI